MCPCVRSRFYICYATSSVCMYGVDYIYLYRTSCVRVYGIAYIFLYGTSSVRVYRVYILWNIVCPCVRSRFYIFIEYRVSVCTE